MESADPGWSFKSAVGASLPSTFFSYGQSSMPSENQLVSLSDVVLDSSETTSTSSGRPSTILKRDQPARHHRFLSIHERRQLGAIPTGSLDNSSLTDQEKVCTVKGYSDGLMTAKIFATQGLSKLGFIDQYISDSIKTLGPSVILVGMDQTYKQAFLKGLRDGEEVIAAALG
jgi:glucan 1,3-beta-glucosidase